MHQDGGEPVTIRVADVVTGKPVPPRPSVRHRVAAQDVELHVASLWPDMTTEPLDGWLLRACPPQGGRLRRRGNSAFAMTEPDVRLSAATAAVRSFYADRGQVPADPVSGRLPLELALEPLGFSPLGVETRTASWRRCRGRCVHVTGVYRTGRPPNGRGRGPNAGYIEEGTDGIRVSLGGVRRAAGPRSTATGSACTTSSSIRRSAGRGSAPACRRAARLGRIPGRDHRMAACRDRQRGRPGDVRATRVVTHHTNRYLSG